MKDGIILSVYNGRFSAHRKTPVLSKCQFLAIHVLKYHRILDVIPRYSSEITSRSCPDAKANICNSSLHYACGQTLSIFPHRAEMRSTCLFKICTCKYFEENFRVRPVLRFWSWALLHAWGLLARECIKTFVLTHGNTLIKSCTLRTFRST